MFRYLALEKTRYLLMRNNILRTTIPLFLLILSLPQVMLSQTESTELSRATEEVIRVNRKLDSLNTRVEELKMDKLMADLHSTGLPALAPDEKIISHSAYALVYDENHEQAKWVAHMILPDIIQGNEGRTNDFRVDPLITSGSSEEEDYFLKFPKEGGGFTYDGFGYDRGHLAPSADFRYSKKALSESYFYSNMSPQVAELNRGRWAEMEDAIRAYVIRNNAPVYVVTGGILRDDLPKIPRSTNGVSVPKEYFKVVYDPVKRSGIAFVMPNKACEYPVMHYACTIDSVEVLTSLDFFHLLDDTLENRVEKELNRFSWVGERELGDVLPLRADDLPRNTFNTVQAQYYMGKNDEIKVCGTVVSTKRSSRNNVFLNLDKQFPNQIFTVTIFSDYTANFSYNPDEFLKGKEVCVTGKVTNFNGTPTMNITHEKAIEIGE